MFITENKDIVNVFYYFLKNLNFINFKVSEFPNFFPLWKKTSFVSSQSERSLYVSEGVGAGGDLKNTFKGTSHNAPKLRPAHALVCSWLKYDHILKFKSAVSPIIRSAPKYSSRHFIFHRNSHLWSGICIRVPFKPLTVFSLQKPFYN